MPTIVVDFAAWPGGGVREGGEDLISVFKRYQRASRRRYRHAATSSHRLDIQGLRMVAILTVFASHLWDWPPGGSSASMCSL